MQSKAERLIVEVARALAESDCCVFGDMGPRNTAAYLDNARVAIDIIVERCERAAGAALIDAAHLYRGTPDSSAMFKAETLATNAIRSLSPEAPQPEAREAREDE